MTLDPSDIEAKKDQLIWSARRCFDLRLQTNAGGNLSVRLSSGDAIVIKPSGVGFAECTRDNLQVVHLDGTLEPSAHKPSKDLDFHLALYRIRPDINGIVRVVMKGKKRCDYQFDPILVQGTLKVVPTREDGYCIDIFQLHADSVKLVEDARKKKGSGKQP